MRGGVIIRSSEEAAGAVVGTQLVTWRRERAGRKREVFWPIGGNNYTDGAEENRTPGIARDFHLYIIRSYDSSYRRRLVYTESNLSNLDSAVRLKFNKNHGKLMTRCSGGHFKTKSTLEQDCGHCREGRLFVVVSWRRDVWQFIWKRVI